MFLWFLGLAFLGVLIVFSSPALDYRLVMLGAVLPVLEIPLGGPWLLHTLLGPSIVLTVVMLSTQNRRLVRRRWLGVPIGLFIHLVLDASWADAELFWWPVLGIDGVLGAGDVPEAGRGLPAILVMEAIGLGALIFLVRRLDLLGEGRELFVRSGQVLRSKLSET